MHIGIVGLGVSGIAFINAMIHKKDDVEITVFEPNELSDHRAFGIVDDLLICNTSAAVMSVNLSEVREFQQFLGITNGSRVFPQRAQYGEYLRSVVAGFSSCVRKITDSVVAVTDLTTKVEVETLTSGFFAFDILVITGSNKVPIIPEVCDLHRAYIPIFASPYDVDYSQWLVENKGATVGILGTGLSGIDAARLALFREVGAIMVSPSGRLPGVRSSLHYESPIHINVDDFVSNSTSPELFHRFLREMCAKVGYDIRNHRAIPGSSSIARFVHDYEECLAGESKWEFLVGPMIDMANKYWSGGNSMMRQRLLSSLEGVIRRRVTAIPLRSAYDLNKGVHDSMFYVSAGLGDGVPVGRKVALESVSSKMPPIDALVCACGYSSAGWINDKGKLCPSEFVSQSKQAVVCDPLPGGWGATAFSRRVFCVGSAASGNTAIPSYVRASVVQSSIVADMIAGNDCSLP